MIKYRVIVAIAFIALGQYLSFLLLCFCVCLLFMYFFYIFLLVLSSGLFVFSAFILLMLEFDLLASFAFDLFIYVPKFSNAVLVLNLSVFFAVFTVHVSGLPIFILSALPIFRSSLFIFCMSNLLILMPSLFISYLSVVYIFRYFFIMLLCAYANTCLCYCFFLLYQCCQLTFLFLNYKSQSKAFILNIKLMNLHKIMLALINNIGILFIIFFASALN